MAWAIDPAAVAVDLASPLRWRGASRDELQMLQDLQANILKGHGRSHTAYLFLKFDAPRAAAARSFLQRLQPTDTLTHLSESATFRATGRPGGTVLSCLLSAAGYEILGVRSKAPRDMAFLAGLAARQAVLNDPPVRAWERPYRSPIHALILLADSDADRLQTARRQLLALMPSGVALAAEEAGARIASRRTEGEAVEHFGFVDGRSNPLLLQEDIDAEVARCGATVWSPRFGLGTVLVPDPAASAPDRFGSLVVFRKLEQDVRAFKTAEKTLARKLHLAGTDKSRAGALMLGRFEDGTPLCLQAHDGRNNPVPNDFDYADDPAGTRCPFHAHIRKMNPRGETAGASHATAARERAHAIVRRGTTYGQRSRHPNDRTLTLADLPSGGVGVLFMAYQSHIEDQFEYLQARWANSVEPPSKGYRPAGVSNGVDPFIGQGAGGERLRRSGQSCATVWGGGSRTPRREVDLQGFVKMRGGEYFFAPALSTLKNL